MRRNLAGLDTLLRTRTAQELVAAQSDLLRQNVEEFFSCGHRLSEITIRITREAVERCHRPA
jgi:hypothetical protein